MEPKFTFFDTFEYAGKWFLPDSKDKHVSGTLKYSKGTFELKTIGSVTSGDTDFITGIKEKYESPTEIPIIQGISTNGTKITLTRCRKTGITSVMKGSTTYSYTGYDCYLGWNFDRDDDILFDTIKISYSNLNRWYPWSGISIDHSDILHDKIKINYSPIKLIEAKINNDFKLGLEIVQNYKHDSVNKKFNIAENTLLTIQSTTQKYYKEFHKLSRCYNYFLMLAVAGNVYPLTISGSTKDFTVSIFPRMILHEDISNVPNPPMLFSYNEIEIDFESFIQKWKILWDSYKDVLDTYFSTLLYMGVSTIEIQFLRIAFVLEAYHRRKFPDQIFPSCATDEILINEMKSKFSNNPRATELLDGIKNKNKGVTLRQRLENLVDFCPDAFEDPEKEKATFAQKVVSTRNFFTHINEEKNENVVTDGLQLFYLTNEMMTLMEGCLLKELSFSDSALKNLIIKNRQIKNYAKNNPIK